MKWEAQTAWNNIGVGTILLIYASPQITGQSPDVLPQQTDIDVFGTNSNWPKARLTGVTSNVATLEMPDGTRWSLKPTICDALIKMSGMHTEKWIVDAQLP